MKPLLSVIVPVYNVEQYLAECVESILNQSFRNFELILVNDGSTDSSLEICKHYQIADNRVRVIDKPNGGQSSARNKGLDEARGKYISFVDSDDYIHLDTFISCVKYLERFDADFVSFPYQRVGSGTDNHYTLSKYLPEKSNEKLFSLWINGKLLTNYLWDKVWSARMFEKLRIPEGMIYEDRFIFVDLLKSVKNAGFISDGMYYYRQHEGQTTMRHDCYALTGMIVADCHIVQEMPGSMVDEMRVVKHRLFSNFIEYHQHFGYNQAISSLVIKSLKVGSVGMNNLRPSLRMILFMTLGGRLYDLLFKFSHQ